MVLFVLLCVDGVCVDEGKPEVGSIDGSAQGAIKLSHPSKLYRYCELLDQQLKGVA